MTIEEFAKMIKDHDLTFSYSDDYYVYSRGHEAFEKIRAASKEFDPDDVKKIWNEIVDSKLAEGFRETFYWKF